MAGDERLQSTSRVEFAPGVSVARSDLRFSFSRSGGPGGQAVNKLSTRAELRVAVDAIEGVDDAAAARLRRLAGKRLNQSDEIVLHAETYRSQLDNKNAALEKLTELVRAALVKPKVRRKKKPSRAMIERRLEAKRRTGEKKRQRQTRRRLDE